MLGVLTWRERVEWRKREIEILEATPGAFLLPDLECSTRQAEEYTETHEIVSSLLSLFQLMKNELIPQLKNLVFVYIYWLLAGNILPFPFNFIRLISFTPINAHVFPSASIIGLFRFQIFVSKLLC